MLARSGGLDWSPLGGNPVPGDPGEVRRLASKFDSIADDVSVQVSRLRNVADDMGCAGVWQGKAATACRPHLDKLPGLLDKVVVSYRKAGGALAGYAPKLSAAQDKAVHALRMATEALSEQTRAQTAARHKLTSSNGSDKDAGPPPAGMLLTALVAADPGVQAADDKLNRAHDLAGEAAGDCKNAASTCADGIHAASDAGIQNPGFFQSIGNAIAGDLSDAWDFAVDAFQYVKDHWVDIVKTISKIAGAISAVLGAIALVTMFIPGVDLITSGLFGAALLISSGTSLITDTSLYATGHGKLSSVLMDAVGVAGGGLTRTLGESARLLKLGKGGEEAISEGTSMINSGSRAMSPSTFTRIATDGRSMTVVRIIDHPSAAEVAAGQRQVDDGIDTVMGGVHDVDKGATSAPKAFAKAGKDWRGIVTEPYKAARDPARAWHDAKAEFSSTLGSHTNLSNVGGRLATYNANLLTGGGNPAVASFKWAQIAGDSYQAQDGVRSAFGVGNPDATGLYGALDGSGGRHAVPAR